MKLTRHTVHEHVKAIYRAMRVHTRSELMSSMFVGARGIPRRPS